jgi:hypothetical protein
MRLDDSRLPDPSILDLLGAGHLIMPMSSSATGKHLVCVFAHEPPLLSPGSMTVLQENLEALPRAWIVHRAIVLPPLVDNRPRQVRQRTEEALYSETTPRDWREEAVIESGVPLPYPPAPSPADIKAGDGTEACRIELYEPQRVVLNAELTSPGLVVLADMFYPGWDLTVDDGTGARPAEILRTNRVLRGVSLPAGNFRLEFRYRPTMFHWGVWISGIGWLGLALATGGWAWGRIRRFSLQRRLRG